MLEKRRERPRTAIIACRVTTAQSQQWHLLHRLQGTQVACGGVVFDRRRVAGGVVFDRRRVVGGAVLDTRRVAGGAVLDTRRVAGTRNIYRS